MCAYEEFMGPSGCPLDGKLKYITAITRGNVILVVIPNIHKPGPRISFLEAGLLAGSVLVNFACVFMVIKGVCLCVCRSVCVCVVWA